MNNISKWKNGPHNSITQTLRGLQSHTCSLVTIKALKINISYKKKKKKQKVKALKVSIFYKRTGLELSPSNTHCNFLQQNMQCLYSPLPLPHVKSPKDRGFVYRPPPLPCTKWYSYLEWIIIYEKWINTTWLLYIITKS